MADTGIDSDGAESPSCAVCVLAYNEEQNMGSTLRAILRGISDENVVVHLYANGCTDRTADVARVVANWYPKLVVHELEIASKPEAWNAGLADHDYDVLVFADGDVVPEPGAVECLRDELWNSPIALISTCRPVPVTKGLNWQQRVVGFMQMPLHQDFVSGRFYAIKRRDILELLSQAGYDGLPSGVTGEDGFLNLLVGTDRLLVSECRAAYKPPNLADYCRYLARIRWQNEQLTLLLPFTYPPSLWSIVKRGVQKVRRAPNKFQVARAIPGVVLKHTFKLVAAHQIRRAYRALGPVGIDGAEVLSVATRAGSTK
jgi:glycosyltransferase involved in cell wall biosynthesis